MGQGRYVWVQVCEALLHQAGSGCPPAGDMSDSDAQVKVRQAADAWAAVKQVPKGSCARQTSLQALARVCCKC